MHPNILLSVDGFKHSQAGLYPPGTTHVYSYIENRQGQYTYHTCVFFGLQYYLKKYLAGSVVTPERIDEAETLISDFDRKRWEYIVDRHGGRLPVSIRAVPEGSVVPISNVLLTVENTDPECYWLTNFLESILLQVWYGSTVATLSREMKMVILNALDRTGDPLTIDFKLHDYSSRAAPSMEAAGVGGCAHLVNFKGSNNLAGLSVAQDYYDCPMAGFNFPTADHGTITPWGEGHECGALLNLLEKFPAGSISAVGDSFDLGRTCKDYWGQNLKDRVIGRQGEVYVNPDSGHPQEMAYGTVAALKNAFPLQQNEKGFYTLQSGIRILLVNGIDLEMLTKALESLESHRYSADNISFGWSSFNVNIETLRFAFNCSSVTVNGADMEVLKRPKWDTTKASKPGKLKLIHDGNAFQTVGQGAAGVDQLVEIFRDGEILLTYTLDEIRQRAFVD